MAVNSRIPRNFSVRSPTGELKKLYGPSFPSPFSFHHVKAGSPGYRMLSSLSIIRRKPGEEYTICNIKISGRFRLYLFVSSYISST